MCYTRISGTRNGRKAIAYALGNGCGHNGHKNRNLMIGTVGLLPEEFGSYIEQMEMTWAQKLSRNNLNEIRRVIVSFSKNELSKDKPEDIELAMQMCQEFVQDAYDGHDALICLSADGVGEKLHAHILVNNVSSRDFKGCTREQTHFSYVKSNWNRIQSKYVTIDLGKGPKEKISQNERRMRDENRRYAEEGLEGPNYIWKDDLRNRIRIAMNTASSKEEFIDTLEKNGVVAKTRKEGKPGTYFAFELIDIPQRYECIRGSFKARSYSLGTDYDYDTIMDKISENRAKNPLKEVTNKPVSVNYEKVYAPLPSVSTRKTNTDDGNNNSSTSTSSSQSSGGGSSVTVTREENKTPTTDATVEKTTTKPRTAFERMKAERDRLDKEELERRFDRQLEYGFGKEF